MILQELLDDIESNLDSNRRKKITFHFSEKYATFELEYDGGILLENEIQLTFKEK